MTEVVLAAAAFCLLGLAWRTIELIKRRKTPMLSRPRGRKAAGVVYAYTLGLAPWSKESTRLHSILYLRGILFHIAILTSMIWLIISLLGLDGRALPVGWFWLLWTLTIIGTLGGWAGLVQRLVSPELRNLSIPDDYLAVFLVSVFQTLAVLYAWLPNTGTAFQIMGALLLVYIPLGKITHLVYWLYIRYSFGMRYGLRGIIPHPLPFGEGQHHES